MRRRKCKGACVLPLRPCIVRDASGSYHFWYCSLCGHACRVVKLTSPPPKPGKRRVA